MDIFETKKALAKRYASIPPVFNYDQNWRDQPMVQPIDHNSYEEDLKRRQAEHLRRVRERQTQPYQPCAHTNCPLCIGTGIKADGSACIHFPHCTCPKCNPYLMYQPKPEYWLMPPSTEQPMNQTRSTGLYCPSVQTSDIANSCQDPSYAFSTQITC